MKDTQSVTKRLSKHRWKRGGEGRQETILGLQQRPSGVGLVDQGRDG